MFPTHLIRLTQAAMLAAVVAVFIPTIASGKPLAAPDAFERYVAAHPYGQGVIDTSQAPDIIDRYVKSHGSQSTVVLDGRSPDTLDAAYNTQFQVSDGRSPDTLDAAQNAQGSQLQILDGRSPDTIDAAQTTQPVELVSSSGFDWSDAGIGAASGAGALLLMAVFMLGLVRMVRRHNVQAT
jgi:hypothetical protein